LDLGFLIAGEVQSFIKLVEVRPGNDFETCNHTLSSKIFDGLERSVFWSLDLQHALSKPEAMDFGDQIFDLGLQDNIVARYTKVDVSVTDE